LNNFLIYRDIIGYNMIITERVLRKEIRIALLEQAILNEQDPTRREFLKKMLGTAGVVATGGIPKLASARSSNFKVSKKYIEFRKNLADEISRLSRSEIKSLLDLNDGIYKDEKFYENLTDSEKDDYDIFLNDIRYPHIRYVICKIAKSPEWQKDFKKEYPPSQYRGINYEISPSIINMILVDLKSTVKIEKDNAESRKKLFKKLMKNHQLQQRYLNTGEAGLYYVWRDMGGCWFKWNPEAKALNMINIIADEGIYKIDKLSNSEKDDIEYKDQSRNAWMWRNPYKFKKGKKVDNPDYQIFKSLFVLDEDGNRYCKEEPPGIEPSK
jgi:hypothetical protein